MKIFTILWFIICFFGSSDGAIQTLLDKYYLLSIDYKDVVVNDCGGKS